MRLRHLLCWILGTVAKDDGRKARPAAVLALVTLNLNSKTSPSPNHFVILGHLHFVFLGNPTLRHPWAPAQGSSAALGLTMHLQPALRLPEGSRGTMCGFATYYAGSLARWPRMTGRKARPAAALALVTLNLNSKTSPSPTRFVILGHLHFVFLGNPTLRHPWAPAQGSSAALGLTHASSTRPTLA